MAQSGDILADRWRIVDKIDAGAMGEIFRGQHRVMGHAVAIKVMMPEIARDATAIERFLREAKIAARLQHRNVVRVEDMGIAADGGPFLVMELLHGESLARRMSRAPRVTPTETLGMVRQVAQALDAAHGANIVHRDLKPENVFITRDTEDGVPVVKVLDFGIAKYTDTLSAAPGAISGNTVVGTPRYMSPEQARSSRELDGRSDLWALGILTYELLTGHHPFETSAVPELLIAVLTQKIPPPTSLAPELPPALDVWTARALARSKTDRFATARAMIDALEESLANEVGDWAPRDPRTDALRPRCSTLKTRPRPSAIAPSVVSDIRPPSDPPAGYPVRDRPSRTTAAAIALALCAGLGLVTVTRHTPWAHPRAALSGNTHVDPSTAPPTPPTTAVAPPVPTPIPTPAATAVAGLTNPQEPQTTPASHGHRRHHHRRRAG